MIAASCRYDPSFTGRDINLFSSLLPAQMRERVTRFRLLKDAQLYVAGKLLLRYLLVSQGLASESLEKIEYKPSRCPYIPGGAFFSTSHSGQIVVCALALDQRLGIDIEIIQNVDIADFATVFTTNELRMIKSAANPVKEFFKFWTRKEAVLKATTEGFQIPAAQVDVVSENVRINGTNWFLKELFLDDSYAFHIATDSVLTGPMVVTGLRLQEIADVY